jgi:hypothetical protein
MHSLESAEEMLRREISEEYIKREKIVERIEEAVPSFLPVIVAVWSSRDESGIVGIPLVEIRSLVLLGERDFLLGTYRTNDPDVAWSEYKRNVNELNRDNFNEIIKFVRGDEERGAPKTSVLLYRGANAFWFDYQIRKAKERVRAFVERRNASLTKQKLIPNIVYAIPVFVAKVVLERGRHEGAFIDLFHTSTRRSVTFLRSYS